MPGMIGRWHGRFVHIPMATAIRERNKVDPNGETVEGDVIRFDTALVMVPVSVLDRLCPRTLLQPAWRPKARL